MMDKNLKQAHDATRYSYSYSSKKVALLSFLTALQVSSCSMSRRQGLIGRNGPRSNDCQLPARHGEIVAPDALKKLQEKTVDTLLKYSPAFNGIDAFFKAVKKCDLQSVQSLLKRSPITSKEIVKALKYTLKYEDTLSFRYKHEKIVHWLLTKCDFVALEDLYVQDGSGMTVLHLLIKRGDIYGVQFLTAKLPLKGLCTEDSKGRTPMHVAARYKSKKMFGILFDRISKLDRVQAIEELFKKDKMGYSVIEYSHLPKDRCWSALWNNSHIQLPTFCRKGNEMFKYILLNLLPNLDIRLNVHQLIAIARGIEDIGESGIIYKGYAGTLRSIVSRYIKNSYGNNAAQMLKEVAHAKNLVTS